MLDAYRRVLARPGALAFSLSGLVARLPVSMMTLGIVVLVSSLSGSYAVAGQVSAAYIIGNAVVAVPHGRLADRVGQTRVLVADAVLFLVASSLLVSGVRAGWSAPWPHLCAAVAGVALPQVGSLVRARWASLLPEPGDRQTAFAVESVVDETVFVTGPAAVTLLATLIAPEAGLVTAVVLGTAGTLLLASQRGSAPPPHPREPGQLTEPMPWLTLVPITLAGAALGGLFGGQEVAAVAFATDAGHRPVSGLLLALFSAGSLLGGLLTGARTWRTPVRTRLRAGMALLFLGTLTLPWAPGLAVLAVLMLVTGGALAPTLISLFSLLEEAAPRARLIEAMGLLQTGMAAGIAPGAYLGGVVADRHGGSAAFWVCSAAGAVACLVVLLPLRAASSSAAPGGPASSGGLPTRVSPVGAEPLK